MEIKHVLLIKYSKQLIWRFRIISPALLECPIPFRNVRTKTLIKSILAPADRLAKSVFLLKGPNNNARLCSLVKLDCPRLVAFPGEPIGYKNNMPLIVNALFFLEK
jgi:hypothetical protein